MSHSKTNFDTKSREEILREINAALKEATPEMTEEELIEYEAEYGYYPDDED